jgi:hypothetical protein
MFGLVVAEVIVVWLVCAFGAPGLPALHFPMATALLGISIGCFIINDAIKVLWIHVFENDD